jgi:osmotically inducible lipoprotein OsmB
MKAKFLYAAMALVLLAGSLGCNTTPTQDGAVAGGLLGAAAGAIIGNQSHGRSGEGALIGAGLGALTGALVGDQVDEHRTRYHRAPVAAAPAPAATASPAPVVYGHYETRIVRAPSGETYEERVWVPDPR